ncbi:MAG TPA: DNA mismatch repair protein MutS, partial [Pseudomonadales bacterium]|nr:DNA mismatch repair protein MutS [Pseudomonadales bacterium]
MFASDDEFDLFKSEMADVKRLQVNKVVLKRKDNVDPAVRLNAEKASQETADELSDPWSNDDLVGPDDFLVYKQTGVQETQFNRLRQGKFPVEAELDLHGMKQEKARDAVVRFLRDAQKHQARVV